jgi:hypothetical protein
MNDYGLNILLGLNRFGKHIYGGTVDPAVVTKRRSRNKTAGKQRQVNRKRDTNAR